MSGYDWEAIWPELLDWLADGRSLTAFCRKEGVPKPTTVYDYRDSDNQRAVEYARARGIGMHAIAERLQETARGKGEDAEEDVQRTKLIIETDMRLLKCWSPHVYGDRVDHTVTPKAAEPITFIRATRPDDASTAD